MLSTITQKKEEIKEEIKEESPLFCPYCDSCSVSLIDGDTYDHICNSCGHEWTEEF